MLSSSPWLRADMAGLSHVRCAEVCLFGTSVPTSADGDSGGLVGGSSEDEAKTPRDDESQVDAE